MLVVHRLPGFGWLVDGWNTGWSHVAPWLARHLFHITTAFPDTSDGLLDVTYSYARLACVLLFATVATLVWSVVDRRRGSYATLDDAMRVWLRYGLANAMFFYGFSKVLPHQFGSTSLERLVEAVRRDVAHDALVVVHGAVRSVHGLLRCSRVPSGALLLFRRTATLGAIVVIGVMANVVMLDFSYGVYVKLFATHLLAFAVILAAPEMRHLWRVLVLHEASPARSFGPHATTTAGARAERPRQGARCDVHRRVHGLGADRGVALFEGATTVPESIRDLGGRFIRPERRRVPAPGDRRGTVAPPS